MKQNIKRFKGTEIEVEYLLTGEQNENTLVFVHGAGTNLRQFFSQHEYFSDKYRVLSLSLRGHGGSQPPKDERVEAYTITRHTQDVMELLEYLRITKFHYIGNSVGGMIGYEIISQRPEWFLTITTYGTAPEIKWNKLMVNLVVGMDKMMVKINRKGYMKFLSNAITKHEYARKQMFDLLMACDKDGAWRIRANIGNYSYLSVIEKIKVPALIIKGEWDKDINNLINSVSGVIDNNPYYSVVDLKNAGHVANLDRSLEFNKIIEQHIEFKEEINFVE